MFKVKFIKKPNVLENILKKHSKTPLINQTLAGMFYAHVHNRLITGGYLIIC